MKLNGATLWLDRLSYCPSSSVLPFFMLLPFFAVGVCDSHTCLNGGTVTNTAGVCGCDCVGGFTGDTCEGRPTSIWFFSENNTLRTLVSFSSIIYNIKSIAVGLHTWQSDLNQTTWSTERAFISWSSWVAAPSSLFLRFIKPLSRNTNGGWLSMHKELEGNDSQQPGSEQSSIHSFYIKSMPSMPLWLNQGAYNQPLWL